MNPRMGTFEHAKLTDDCLEYVKQEEACLTSLLKSAVRMREALRKGQWTELGELVPTLEPVLLERERLQTSGRELRQRLGALPAKSAAEPTLEELADLAPPAEARRLRDGKARLRALALDLRKQTESTAYVARHHLDFFQGFFTELTRPSGDAATYGSEGQLRQAARTSLLQVRG